MATAYTEYPLDLYGTNLRVSTQPEAWPSMLEGLEVIEEAKEIHEAIGQTFGARNGTEYTIAVYVSDVFDDPIDQALVVAHEATHAAGFLYDFLGADQNGLDEPFAYLVGWMTQKIMLTLRGLEEEEDDD